MNMKPAEHLVTQGAISPEVLANMSPSEVLRQVAAHFRCGFVETLPPDALRPEILNDFPVDYARQRNVLPVWLEDQLCLLMEDPADVDALQDAALLLSGDPHPVVATEELIRSAIDAVYFEQSHRSHPAAANLESASAEAASGSRGFDGDLLRSSDDAPVTRLVNSVLLQALQENASDIHIEPFPTRLRLRTRVDGILREQADLPKSLEASLTSRLKIMARLDIAEKRLPQDGTARVVVGEREIDIRMSTVPVAAGERIVLRLLRHDTSLLPLEELGMSAAGLAAFRDLLEMPHGVVWVTGPTGSGKTTSLYSALAEVDTGNRNVLTIEDPVEYQLPDIGQISVKPKIGLTFATGLRSILRQDPDIILVGETRDTETADIVVQASLTGHLVFSTLHTNDAVGSVVRLVDMGVEPFLVAESCRAAMAQRLLRRLHPERRLAFEVGESHVAEWGEWSRSLLGETVHVADGDEGYAGRVGVFELIPFTESFQDAIRAGADRQTLLEHAHPAGGITLHRDALNKVRAGLTDPREVTRVLGRGGA